MKDLNAIERSVRKILIEEWDPVGIRDVPQAQDEYDSYIPEIVRLLHQGCDEHEIRGYLRKLENVDIQASSDDERRSVAARLIANLASMT